MLKTFLVEDEVVIREMIKKMIPWEQYGFELAGEASDGEMALPLILKSKPDLLITDIKMPFMDGLTLCKLVKKELPDIKIVILSGYDDFNYAKQAINIGVEDYLLKPITKNAFIERLEEIHNRYEHEKTQKEYYEKFKLEMQEYERNASRDFFESLVRADFDLEEIYRRADRLNLDIVAEAYNILIFTPDASDSSCNSSEGYSDWEAEVHKKIENYFLSHPVAMLFRHQVFSYAILVKGQRDTIKKNTCECVETIQKIMEETRANVDWFVAVGEEADRLSRIKQSYHTAARTYAFRYLYDGHILYYNMLEQVKENSADTSKTEAVQLKNVNINALNPEILQKFLSSGLEDEDEYTFSGSSSSNFKLTLASSIKSRYDKVEYVSARKTDGGATIILNIRLVFDKDADMSNAAAPGSVEWSASSEGTATWGDVSSAKYFQVQLYKDGNLVTPPDGSASTVSVYGTSYDFSSWVSAGSKYTFKVRSVKASNNAKSKWVSSSSWTPGSNTSDNNNTNTFPEGWQKAADGIRWWWQNPDGSYPASQWKETDGKWYYFDAEGYMATGWINVGGVDYCLAPDGALYVSCTTPDGYNVDANGAWIH